jgi:hypothetical protein
MRPRTGVQEELQKEFQAGFTGDKGVEHFLVNGEG